MSEERAPFLGVYINKSGELIDLFSGEVVTPDQIKPDMSPFYGVFLDKDGNEHDLSEFLAGG
jgi:hypothetical protein